MQHCIVFYMTRVIYGDCYATQWLPAALEYKQISACIDCLVLGTTALVTQYRLQVWSCLETTRSDLSTVAPYWCCMGGYGFKIWWLTEPTSGTLCNEQLQSSFSKLKCSFICQVLVCELIWPTLYLCRCKGFPRAIAAAEEPIVEWPWGWKIFGPQRFRHPKKRCIFGKYTICPLSPRAL